MQKTKLIRTATVAMSLDILLKGQLDFLNKHYQVIAVSGKDDYLKNVESREAVRVIDVQISRNIAPVKDFISLIKLYRVFKKEKPQIVHSITPKAGLLSMTAAYFARVPIRIHTFTGLIFPYKKGFFRLLLLYMDKITCKFATHIIPEGQGVKNDLMANKVTTKPLNIIANGNVNGIDTDYFNPDIQTETDKMDLKAQLGINLHDFVYTYVGRLVGDKGINELVLAFTEINNQYPNCKLLLVGPYENDLDPLQSDVLNLINTNKNIITTGFVHDIRTYLSISNVFVFPSHREGFPNVVLQACAMKLPCIVTNISGSNEIINDNQSGLIVAVKSEKQLKDKMLLLYKDVTLLNRLKSNTREGIVSKFNQQLVWNSLLEVYKKAEENV